MTTPIATVRVTTADGATYDFADPQAGFPWVTRVRSTHPDWLDRWHECIIMRCVVGQTMVLWMDRPESWESAVVVSRSSITHTYTEDDNERRR